MDEKPKETIKVLDRRKFTAAGERREGVDPPVPEPVLKGPLTPGASPAPPSKDSGSHGPSGASGSESGQGEPAVSEPFLILLQELAQSCAMSLGAPDAMGTRGSMDLQAANLYIDFIEALRTKTLGNLAPQEAKILEDLLFQLKMLYAKAGSTRPS